MVTAPPPQAKVLLMHSQALVFTTNSASLYFEAHFGVQAALRTLRAWPKELVFMLKENKVIMTGLLGLGALATLGAFFPVSSAPLSSTFVSQTGSHEESVSGTIISFDKNSFTLNIGATASEERQQDERGAMTFVIDENTTINGRMHVGANAEVTYREFNGHNLAVSIIVVE